MLNFIKKQWNKDTFHFWWILITILIFWYFLQEYLLDAIDGLVSIETKVFTPIVFWFFSICSIWLVIWYFLIIKILNYYKIVNKKYIKQIITIIYMTLLTIILYLFFVFLVHIYPEHTIEYIKKEKSWLILNFKKYKNIKNYHTSSTSSDSNWIFALWHVVECKNWKSYFIENFFYRKKNENILDKNWKEIKKIKIYNHSTKEETIINFEEKEKYFKKLCSVK